MSARWKKILIVWSAILAAYLLVMQLLDHEQVPPSLFATWAAEILSFLICLAIVRHEPVVKNKVIFLNFSFFFATVVFGMIGTFIPTSYFKLYFDQYLSQGMYGFLLTFSLAYLTVDVLFRDYRVVAKYLLSFALAGGLFWLYFHPFITDPSHSYNTQDIKDWRTVNSADTAFVNRNGRHATVQELAAGINLYIYDGGDTVAVLQPEARTRRVAELMPYLGDNYTPLVAKPIQIYLVRMAVACIGFILLFFGYLYMKDPPQGAYIEKIMFLWLVFCSLEVLHAWSVIKAVEWQTVSELFAVGRYTSVFAMLLLAVYLSLRLRFITSVKGEFYESELVERPAGITRWRDTLDNLVVEKFFNRQTLLGRMFALPEHHHRT